MTIAVAPPGAPIRGRRVLPGFTLSRGTTLLYPTLIVLILKGAGMGPARFWAIVTSPRAVAALQITLTAAAIATGGNALDGLLMAWVLVRYEFPGKRVLDALMDVPFALPTAEAGLSLTALFSANAWLGAVLHPAGVPVVFTIWGIALAMAFSSVPFVVRTVQPVLEYIDAAPEDAAETLGARPWQILTRDFSRGWEVYLSNILHPLTLHAMWLTTLVALIVVPLNVAFGAAAAWAVAMHRFPGRGILVMIIEIPVSISPIIASICYLLLFGRQGLLGPWLQANDLQVMCALPGIVLVTMFVTAPFVAREVLPLMKARGSEQEQAAVTLGASGWQVFRRVTLRNIKWALLYGAVLCTARALGAFGGVSVVSGNIRAQTNTLPLHLELLFHHLNAVERLRPPPP